MGSGGRNEFNNRLLVRIGESKIFHEPDIIQDGGQYNFIELWKLHTINPFNWDLREINRYKDEKCFAYDGNRIKWTDTYEMLRLFIKCGVSQQGRRKIDNWGGQYSYIRVLHN